MIHRRALLLSSLFIPVGARAAAAAGAAPAPPAIGGAFEALVAMPPGLRPLDEDTSDEDFWAAIGRLFPVDRALINLNNGGVHPTAAGALAALERHQRTTQEAPAYTLWRELEPRKEGVRQALAKHAGVSPEEIAITRNTSEGLEALQLGFDLEVGDEVLTTTQDYPRMLATFAQRERRDGIKLVRIPIPTPCDDPSAIVRRFAAGITQRTRLILVSQMVFLTGQVCPVREITALGRARGIPVLVDGAHGFAHTPESIADLDVDFYATSLHKWLAAPQGTGLLYVRRERIPDVWPLMAAAEAQSSDIRKFEEIGTHPAAPILAVADALDLTRAIGAARKHARLVHLREAWLAPVLELGKGRVRCLTPRAPELSGALATVHVDGMDPVALSGHLWQNHRIFTVAVRHGDPARATPSDGDTFEGLRVTPSVYTRPAELERFVDALGHVLTHGLPA